MKDWDNYRIILALKRAGTLRGAAEQLGVNHATISRRLALINKVYGSPIFERIAGGYRATPLGQELLGSASQIEQITFSADRLHRTKEIGLSGPITLSLPPTIAQYLLLNELDEFTKLYPDIELSLHTSNRRVDLDRSEADVVIRGDNQPPEHLVGRPLFDYYLSYYANRHYLEHTPRAELRWIAKLNDTVQDQWIKNSPFPEVEIGIRIDDIIMRHQSAVAGFGLTRGACYMAEQEPELVRLPGAKPEPAQQLWVLTHPDLRNTPRIKVLMQFLCDAISAKRPLITGSPQVNQ